MESVGDVASFDDVAEALADVQRRRLLVALLERDATAIPTGEESDTDSESATPEDRLSLAHVHIPKLARHGFIERDERAEEVRRGPNFEDIRPLLELMDTHEEALPDDWV